MQKSISTLLLAFIMFQWLPSYGQQPVRLLSPCEQYYYAYVQATLNKLKRMVSPEIFNLAKEYIALVRQQDLTEAHMVAKEQQIKARNYQDSPEFIGNLRKPYDQYVGCSRLDIVSPQRVSPTSPACQFLYEEAVQVMLQKVRPNMLPLAQEYVALVKQYGDDASRLLILDRYFLNTMQIQGFLRQPFTQYTACNDVKSSLPLSH
jgi:hypothetical protein